MRQGHEAQLSDHAGFYDLPIYFEIIKQASILGIKAYYRKVTRNT